MWPFKKAEVKALPEAPQIVSMGMAPQPLVITSGSGEPSYDEAWHRLLSIAGHVSRHLESGMKAASHWEDEHWREATHYIGSLGMLIPQMPKARQDVEHHKLEAIIDRLTYLGWSPRRKK